MCGNERKGIEVILENLTSRMEQGEKEAQLGWRGKGRGNGIKNRQGISIMKPIPRKISSAKTGFYGLTSI